MKKFLVTVIVSIVIVFSFLSCTENQRARTFGGTAIVNVEPGKKVIMATWKNEDLFYLVEDMDSDYVPHEKTLIESSSFGVIESKVVFKESR